MEGCSVLRVITDEIPHSQVVPKVTQIVTSHGNIHCEYFVNASGMVRYYFLYKRYPYNPTLCPYIWENI